ncbi:PAQR family membrane homeostasis protein TrhA [Parvularcula marina]|uniref:Hemolysin III family protein n=1 Tax=Parvularcula marina TaxID=2292771 RepID=A0A371RID7_9PROT|nr:hemolysin III family protein [Parvularcula marina]RFB05200.1 hemolysin III family protein [Parvularcula marina]
MVLPKRAAEAHDVHTALEEVLHAVTHGVGIILAIIALVFLILKAVAVGSGAAGITAVSIYGGCAIFLYIASTVYHACFKLSVQPFLEVIDHAAIYLKIAGSYTPFALITLPDMTGKVILAVVWSVAAIGVAMKFVVHFFAGLKKYDWLSLASYIGMGWIAIFIVHQLIQNMALSGFIWLVAGGLCFTVGAVFYAWKSRAFTHTIFHCFVLAGSICHFIAIYGFVLNERAAA